MTMQTRRCRTCDTRKGLGHFPIMSGGNRSWTCRACETAVHATERPEPVETSGRIRLGHLSDPTDVRLTPTCTACGQLTDHATTLRMPPELIEASRAADILVTGAVHRCDGQLTVVAS